MKKKKGVGLIWLFREKGFWKKKGGSHSVKGESFKQKKKKGIHGGGKISLEERRHWGNDKRVRVAKKKNGDN